MIALATILLFLSQQSLDDLLTSGSQKAKAKDFKGALADANRALELDPKSVSAYELRADVRTGLGDLKGTVEDYSEAIRLQPNRWYSWFGRGVTRINTKDPDGAINDLTRAIEIKPRNPLSYWNRGTAHWRKKNTSSAMEDFSKAIELQPKYTDAYASRGHLRDESGDVDGALADLSNAIQLGSKAAWDFQARGTIYLYRKKSPEKALADFEQAILCEPENPLGFFFRAAARVEREEWDLAIEDFKRSIKLDPKATTSMLGLALIRQRLGDRGGAISELDRAIALGENDLTRFHRGCVYYDLGNWKEALSDFRRVQDLKAGYLDSAAWRIWMCRMQLGEREAATRELKSFFASRQGGDEGDRRIGSFLVGAISEQELLATMESSGQKTRAWFCIGTTRLLKGDRDGAVTGFKTCVAQGEKSTFEHLSAVAALDLLK
jgi:tetratricopeptide (TPR) repeat protein